jgi:hypothetical protein
MLLFIAIELAAVIGLLAELLRRVAIPKNDKKDEVKIVRRLDSGDWLIQRKESF